MAVSIIAPHKSRQQLAQLMDTEQPGSDVPEKMNKNSYIRVEAPLKAHYLNVTKKNKKCSPNSYPSFSL